MKNFPNNFVVLVITSPPYDNIRAYKGNFDNMRDDKGYSFDFEAIAKELYRIMKQGGVIVWVVADSTLNGNESGTSLKQAGYFQEIGFNLHDIMIWKKTGLGIAGSNYCYLQNFDYVFILSKGKPKTFNPIKDRIDDITGDLTIRTNSWKISSQSCKVHKATFPEKLVSGHILTWSNEGDLVYDPFSGSGTTGKMALLSGRNFIGSELAEEYCDYARTRIKNAVNGKR
jgi:site-specific DNA-methyltransferase (adenine-specific)